MCTGERYWTINIFVQELEVTEEDMIRFFTIVHSEDNFMTKVIVPNIALPKLLRKVVVMMVFNFFSPLKLMGQTYYRFFIN